MSEKLKLEWRFSALIGLIVATYVAAVASYAAQQGALDGIASADLNPAMLIIFGGTLGVLVLAFFVRSAWRRRGEPALVWRDFSIAILRPDRLLARVTIFAGWFLMMMAFSPFKDLIGRVRGFPLDPILTRIGPMLFFGHHGWEITHALFGGPFATAILQCAYTAWFLIVWLSLIYCIVRSDDAVFRMRFVLSFLLCWILVGSVAAYWLASAGPCFYQQVFGDAHYAPLMQRLHMLDHQIASVAPSWRLMSLDEQQWLWSAYTDNANSFGAGISAMPSMHVAFSALMARAAFALDRRTGWIMSVYALTIWIASMHLGWHYAIDGIVGAPMGVATWCLADQLLRATALRKAGLPAALPEGAAAG